MGYCQLQYMYLDVINQGHWYHNLYNIVRFILKYRGGCGGSLGGLRNASTVYMSRTIQTYQTYRYFGTYSY